MFEQILVAISGNQSFDDEDDGLGANSSACSNFFMEPDGRDEDEVNNEFFKARMLPFTNLVCLNGAHLYLAMETVVVSPSTTRSCTGRCEGVDHASPFRLAKQDILHTPMDQLVIH